LSQFAHATGCYFAAFILRDEWERDSTLEFDEKSGLYRFLTACCFIGDCAILGALFTGGLIAIPFMIFAYLMQVFFQWKIDWKNPDFFGDLYWTRKSKSHDKKDQT
jgi:hypothetical protein